MALPSRARTPVIGLRRRRQIIAYCGQALVKHRFGVRPEVIDRVYLAGGFANYIDVSAAIEIGCLAPVPADRVVKAGNASALGARTRRLLQRARTEVESLIRRFEHVELETMPELFDAFVDGCQFPP